MPNHNLMKLHVRVFRFIVFADCARDRPPIKIVPNDYIFIIMYVRIKLLLIYRMIHRACVHLLVLRQYAVIPNWIFVLFKNTRSTIYYGILKSVCI